MALENFIPELWSARLLQNLQTNLVYGSEGVVNRDYEGEISSMGDTVHINNIGRVTVSDYSKNGTVAAAETLTDATQALTITQAKAFNFKIDDIDQAQQRPKVMNEAMREAAYALKNTADKYLAALYTGAGISGTTSGLGDDTTPLTFATPEAVYEFVVDCSTLLDEQDTPEEGRWIIIPPFMEGKLLKDKRFVDYGTAQSNDRLSNGRIGKVGGFDIYKSNNVPNTTGTKYKVLFGHNMAWTFAETIKKVEAYRPQDSFSDAVKGLHLYGAKVVRSMQLGVAVVNKS